MPLVDAAPSPRCLPKGPVGCNRVAEYPAGQPRAAFTLIEVLASLAVLSLLVLMIGRMFNEATRAWGGGMRSVEQLATSRNLLDTIARDMTTAAASSKTTFYFTDDYNASPFSRDLFSGPVPGHLDIYSDYNSTVLFVASVNQRPGWFRRIGSMQLQRTLSQTRYSPYRSADGGIMRRWVIPAVGVVPYAHFDPQWPFMMPWGYEFARLAAFRVAAFTVQDNSPVVHSSGEFSSRREGDRLPLYADVLFESLSLSQRRQLHVGMSAAERDEFIRRNAQRHATRVYFPHRTGIALELR